MKEVRVLMGMPIAIEIVDQKANQVIFDQVYKYFSEVETRFSVRKADSEISLINRGELSVKKYSPEMNEILALAAKTTLETDGYFSIHHHDQLDPSGVVKGWAILNAAKLIANAGFNNFYVDAGGDIQVSGKNSQGVDWTIGIENPFNMAEKIKIVRLHNQGIATSGTYIRGQHIYNPFDPDQPITDIVSLTVIGTNVCEADRFATPAFAMGKPGIQFIESLPGFEGYMIDAQGMATFTSGWNQYVVSD